MINLSRISSILLRSQDLYEYSVMYAKSKILILLFEVDATFFERFQTLCLTFPKCLS